MTEQIDGLQFFKPIPPEEYEGYGIDFLLPFEKEIEWFVHPQKYWDDGPWLIFAFLKSPERPDVVTFNISSYDGDYLFAPMVDRNEHPDFHDELRRAKGFNVFEDTTNLFLIDSEEFLDEIIRILEWQGDKLAPPIIQSPPHPYERINKQDYAKWSIRAWDADPIIPGWEMIEYFYYQTFDPLQDPASRTHGTFFQFARNIHSLPMSLTIHHFPFTNLAPDYHHTFNSLGQINLDKNGMAKFIWLIKLNWLSLYEPPQIR